MFWQLLNIEPTTDKKKITNAYREQLVNTNPEDKPEQFKALREAYEQALAYAESGGALEKTPVEKWADQLEELYNDFSRRRDVNCWKQLLSENVCVALGTRIQVEEALLHFFMQKYFLSHEVWLYLNEQFSFTERLNELYEAYPSDFVDYVILNGINFEDTLPMMMFYPGKDGQQCEQYLNLYIKARNAVGKESGQLIEQLLSLSEHHPYGDAMSMIHQISQDNDQSEQLAALVEKYGYEHRLALMLADVYFNNNEFEKCEQVCQKCLDIYPDDTRIMWCLANALGGQEKYKEGIEIIHDLMKLAGGDQRQLEDLNNRRAEWNESLIEKYQQQYQQNPENNDLRLDLSWALLQNERFEEADEISKNLILEETNPFDYYNLLSNIDFCVDRAEEGLDKLNKLIEVIKVMQPDGTKKTAKRIKRLAEMIARKAYYLFTINRVEEGFSTYKEALEVDDKDPDILTQMAQMSYRYKRFEDTIYYARQITKVKPNAYHGFLLLAYGLFMTNKDNEAFDNVNKAIDLYSGDLESYVLKLRLLIRNNAVDPARELLQFLLDNGCGEDLSVQFCQGNIVDFFDKDEEKAFEIYKNIVTKIEEGVFCSISDIVYFHYLVLLGDRRDANKPEDRKEMIAVADKGLKHNKDLYGLLDYKAWLLMRDNQKEEALKIYLQLSEREKHNSEVEFQIGKLYYDDLDHNADLSLEYFLKAFEKGNNGSLFYLAYLYYLMEQFDESERFCLLLREDEERIGNIDVDSYYRMSYIYEKRKQFDLALKENEIALENARKRSMKLTSYYNHKVRLLRMANKPDEAIEVLQYMKESLNVDYAEDDMIDVYLQFGRYDEAKRIIALKLKDASSCSHAAMSLVKLHLLTNHPTKAKLQLFNYKAVMNNGDEEFATKIMNRFEHKTDKIIQQALEKLQAKREQGKNAKEELLRVAEAYLEDENEEKAIEFAKLALEEYHNDPAKYSEAKAMDRVLLGRIYVVLKQFDLAKEQFDAARKYLCNNCSYGQCKDADTFEIYMLVRQGLYKQAYQRCESLINKWCDEEDYVILMELLKKKR